MLRLTSAVENFNPHEHAWKVSALREWYSLLFLPGVHEHHDIEEKIFFPFYATLGATLPPRLASDHTVLMKMLADVQLKLVSMQEQVDESVPITSEQVDAFKSQVTVMCATMLEHLHEEEIVFPPIVEKYGETEYKKVETEILKEILSSPGETPQLVLIGVLKAAGVFQKAGAPGAPEDRGWACEEFCQAFLAGGPPYPVRVLLMPSWVRRYDYLKSLVLSVQGDVPPAPAPGCSCVIA
mmetsp:Transcript_35722/g.77077  ORF Transcript_35722/g.77077 Transcript_35722/m.77077 type:complete len:239 (-) Transcript_35722:41-757(-)